MVTKKELMETNRRPSSTDDYFDLIMEEIQELYNNIKTQTELSIIYIWMGKDLPLSRTRRT